MGDQILLGYHIRLTVQDPHQLEHYVNIVCSLGGTYSPPGHPYSVEFSELANGVTFDSGYHLVFELEELSRLRKVAHLYLNLKAYLFVQIERNEESLHYWDIFIKNVKSLRREARAQKELNLAEHKEHTLLSPGLTTHWS